MAWDNDIPADNTRWDVAAGEIRENWDALEAVLGVDLDTSIVDFTVNDLITKYPIPDIRAFGAGTAESAATNTTAIQDAIDSIDKGMVFVPEGTFLNTGVKIKNKLILTGVGIESTILKKTDAGTLISSDLTNNSYCGIRDMSLKGDAVVTGIKLLDLTGPYEGTFRNVHFAFADTLLTLSEIEGVVKFDSCVFYNSKAGGYNIRLDNVMDMSFINCLINSAEDGVYATRTNARTRLKFEKISSEAVGRLFHINTESQAGVVEFRDINAWDVGSNISDPADGYAFFVGDAGGDYSSMCLFNNVQINVISALTPIIKTPNWSIYAEDCPAGVSADNDKVAYIPRFEIGWGGAYVTSIKKAILDPDLTASTLYDSTGSVALVTSSGYAEFTASGGTGQAQIKPETISTITNKQIMVRFEYKSTTASTPVLNIAGVSAVLSGYSGSTVEQSANTIALPSTTDVWTKCYFYTRYLDEFDPASSYYLLEMADGDEIDIREFEVFECDRPPYSLLDW